MASWLEWLLGLDSIRLARDAPLLLQWDRRAPAWLIFLVAVSGLAFIAMVYRRERTTVPRRATLAVCRGLLLALVLAVFCKPSLVLQRNRIEPSYVALLVDTSASMSLQDTVATHSASPPTAGFAGPPTDDPQPVAAQSDSDEDSYEEHSRLAMIQSALTQNDGAPIRRLLEKNNVQVSAFAESVEPLAFADSAAGWSGIASVIGGLTADGFSTDVGGAIQRTLDKSEGRRLAGVIIASDGRSTQHSDLRAAMELAAGRQVPIYAIAVGSAAPPTDVEIGPLRAAPTVFVHDLVAIEAQVSGRGFSVPTDVQVELVDTALGPDGETVAAATVSISPEQENAAVELRTKPDRLGPIRYRVQSRPVTGEKNLTNNSDQISVTVTDDRLRILYVEGYPRYEYRYLKNALLREKSLEVSVLLLEADEEFVQEGTTPIRRFPDTPEELNRYDVVLFGDIDPRAGWLTQSQMLMLLDFVANEGGGFALLAGERATPRAFLGTPLERLVPVVIDASAPSAASPGTGQGGASSAFRMKLTAEGLTSRPFRFAATADENRRAIEALPELYWCARTLGAKPGATVLAEHPFIPNPRGQGGLPLVVLGQYGAGKIYFQATDDTWRWRRHTGELLHDSYWVQTARELMSGRTVGSRGAQNRKMILKTERRTYPHGTPVHVTAEVLDAQILRQNPEFIEVGLHAYGRLGASQEDPAAPTPAGPKDWRDRALIAELRLTRLSPESNLFEGSIVPPGPGGYVFEPKDATGSPRLRRDLSAGADGAFAAIRVERPDLELRNPTADHESLERAAMATGGRVFDLGRLAEEFASILDRKLQVPDDIVEPLWDSKLVFGLFILMLSMEWTLRKFFGLL